MKKWLVAGIGVGTAVASAGIVGAQAPERGNRPVSIKLSVLGTYASGEFDEGAAEIVAHDPIRQHLFVVNAEARAVDVLDVSNPGEPTYVATLDTGGGGANSVAVRGDLVAVAVEAEEKTEPGSVFFIDAARLVVLDSVTVGALPDMLTFTPDGRHILVANEGEPSADYGVYKADGETQAWTDPEGSVSIITLPRRGLPTEADVRTAGFEAWNPGGRTLAEGVRVFGPEAEPLVSENLEPEYITVDERSRTAYVVLQEANAYGVLDIAAGEFTDIIPFGLKDHSLPGNELDASDRDGIINIRNWPVMGMYQPDGIASYQVGGQTYLVTANEGDARDYLRVLVDEAGEPILDEEGEEVEVGYIEESRFAGRTTEVCLGDSAFLRASRNLGRLNITFATDDPCDGVAHAFGARSFSIWTADGRQVFDSGSDFERITAGLLDADLPDVVFNASNDSNDFDDRSDNKGPEPEGVVLGKVAGRTYAFIGLERVGGIMVYDVTDPANATFVQYLNNRDFSEEAELDDGTANPAAGDLGPEGLAFIEGKDSPTGRPMLAVGNEVSGTTTLFDIVLTTPGNGPRR